MNKIILVILLNFSLFPIFSFAQNKVVNVKGLSTSSSFDSYRILQTAINSLGPLGGRVIIPEGNYYFSSKISIKSNNVELVGNNKCVLNFNFKKVRNPKKKYDDYDGGIEIAKNLNNISIRNLTIKGNTDSNFLAYGIMVWDKSSHINIEKCIIDGFTGGILFNYKNSIVDCNGNIIRNMTFIPVLKAGGYGIVFQSSYKTTTRNNTFENSIYRHAVYYARNQFYSDGGSDHLFSNNTVYGSSQKNYLTGYELSTKILGNSNITIEKNIFIGGIGHVWLVKNEKGYNKEPENITIEDNVFKNILNVPNTKMYAIGCDGETNVRNLNIIGNKFYDNYVNFLIKIQSGVDINISNNLVNRLMKGHFVYVQYGAQNLQINNNTVSGLNPEYDGVLIGGENSKMKYESTVFMSNNHIETALFGLFANNIVDGNISDNTIYSRNTGIYFSKGNFRGKVKGNKIYQGKRGIFDEGKGRIVPFDNNFYNNTIIR